MKMMSYWLDAAKPFASGARGGPEGTADVAIVGAGFTGLSEALALAKKGTKVVVLEADHVPGAASGRNGGMCNIGFAPTSTQDAISTGRPSRAISASRGSCRSSAHTTALRI